jgi:regulator of ribonuclease activity A
MTLPLPTTADLFDVHGDHCQSCPVQFRQYGGRRFFSGPIRTVQCLNDNVRVRKLLETKSEGGVLVVDGGDSLESALLGDIMAELGRKNGWAGIIVFGAIRDAVALAAIDFGVKALGSNPKKSTKEGTGSTDVVIHRGSLAFTPGDWVYSDDDGILVSSQKLA